MASQPALELDPRATALVLMDFQNDIVDPQGKFGSQGVAQQVQEMGALANAARALAAARAAGVAVVHVRVTFRPGYPEANTTAPLFSVIKAGEMLVDGTWGAEIHPDVAPAEDELVLPKRNVSSLTGTELGRWLRVRGISTVVLGGVLTTIVVEGTARQAVDEGFRVVVLADCCASLTREAHEFSVGTVLPLLATVSTADAFAAAVDGG